MRSDPIELRIVRESLEGVVAPSLQSTVMFEALESHGRELPRTTEELMKSVRGSLQDALLKRVGHREAGAVVARIEQLLRTAPTLTPPGGVYFDTRTPPSGIRNRDRDITTEIATAREPVAVLVISAGGSMVARLHAALGRSRVSGVHANDADRVRSVTSSYAPPIVLVDATDFPAIDPTEVADVLSKLPPTTACGVWGADLPYGRSVVFAMAEAGAPAVAFARGEGVEPMLDLIKSRRRSD